MDLIDYLANFNGEFNASLGETGGYITFSNSGRRGNVKCFQISLDSLKKTIEDILNNLHVFENIQDYVEKNWRDNGSVYFTDEVANAMITVQTKPLFSTLSKLIKWGNEPILNSVDDTQKIIISQEALKNTLAKLADTILQYSPQKTKRSVPFNPPLQTIYYGAPGTGKSNTIKREVEDAGKIHFRTTFHPDSDYSTFVGCYKPTKNVRHNLMSYVELIEKCKEYAKRAGYNNQNLTQFGFDYYDSLTEVLKDKTLSYASLLVSANVTDTSASSYVTAGVDLHTKIADKIAPITYDFVPQAFVKAYCDAWNNYTEEKIEDVYLIIEEINRGNCAQIFGDLFQLLDRKNNGFSTYPIDADEDLKKFLLNGTKEDGTPWLVNKDGIKDGKLCLPPNLHIWATMNTSDQSLFPIDSAFKRRWDWKYVPIKRADKEPESKWIIKVDHGGKTYWCYWWEFLVAINYQIEETNHSEDKQLGYFFCKANESGVIDAKIFVNKVIFYLWNDVFKDEDSKVFQYGEKDDDVANITRSGNIYFRHFVDNTDEMVHYFINHLFAMGKDKNPVVPIDYLKNDADPKVFEYLPKMREDSEETPMPTEGNNDEIKEEEGGEIGKVDYTYPEYAKIFDKVDFELQTKGCERIGNGKNSIDYKLKDIPTSICYISARLNKAQNNPYGEVLLWMTTNKTAPEKSKNLRDKIATPTEDVFKTFVNGNLTLRTLEEDPTSIESINRGWVLKNPDIKFTDESLNDDVNWICETMKGLLDDLQPIISESI